MIEVRSTAVHKQHVIHWNDIEAAICEKMGFTHLRDRPVDGGPGFDFWLYFTDRCTDYLPDGISEGAVYLLDDIECIEEDGFTWPNVNDQNALPILKALAELIPENAVEEGFYVDYC